MSRNCILHPGKKSCPGEVKPFDEKTWLKAQACASVRQSKGSTSKYASIILPDSFDDTMGYHVSCYSNFTAIRSSTGQPDTADDSKSYTLRSDVPEKAGQSGIFPPTCVFCDCIAKSKGQFQKEYPGKCETKDAAKVIYEAAVRKDDKRLLAKISGIDMIAKEVKYHHSCKRNYMNHDKGLVEKVSLMDQTPSADDLAFNSLKNHIQESLIECEGAEFLTSLHKRYISFLDDEVKEIQVRSLGDRISKCYPDLKFTKKSKKAGISIYNSRLSEETAIKRANFDHNSIVETAYYLRGLVKELERDLKDLPEPLTVEALAKGQADPPQDLVRFFNVLYTGSTGQGKSERTTRLVKSVSSDVVFAASQGRIKTGKHLTMALGIKSLTGSKKVINILNRMGHCVNYVATEELETQLATEISERKLSTPDGLLRQPGLMTGLAWDNFDQNTETLSGAGTVHDTVGICYQNVSQSAPSDTQDTPAESEMHRKHAQKARTFLSKEKSLEPYRKKPRMSMFSYTKKQIERPIHVTSAEWKDILWMISMNLHPVPSWTGWNALVTEDPLPLQKIQYMENITLPPTQMNVVLETLKVSKKVAEECGQEYAIVTYDLAIAKPAMQIQAEESPRFDNIFICFGAFHIALAYLGCLGLFIDGSGGPNILIDSGVLGTGSQRGFLLGKHYNRCKRLHPLLASAMTRLHFRFFLEETGALSDAEQNMIETFSTDPSPQAMEDVEKSEEYFDLMSRYESFTDETLSGQHGATQQYWMMYIKLVQRLLLFIRACRTNDVQLFVYALEQIIPIFFAGNRPNYSRWMVKYHMNLMNCEKSHPGIMQMLKNGAFSVRRTNKTFSRTAVDMTLEQTVNADAASRHTGMGSFVHSKNARARWMVTRSVRSAVVGELMAAAGINQAEDSTKDLLPNRLKRDHDDLENVVSSIISTMNPFSIGAYNELYCLTSGRKVADDIKKDLLGFIETGEACASEFKSDCLKNPIRFEKPIKRKKIKNFASASVKSRLTVGKNVQEVAGTRDLFGRLLLLSTLENIDLEKVLQYPLTPVPLSLSHIDGSMNTTDKSKLMHKLETYLENPPAQPEEAVHIVDAMFFLHLQKNPPMTFGSLAKWFLQQIVSMSKEVHLVCDVYTTPSIKDTERGRRGDYESAYIITGPDQTRPKDWQVALRSSSFKTALLSFLAGEWEKPAYACVLKDCHLYMTKDTECISFRVVGEFVQKETVEELKCYHEEADSRIIFHLDFITAVQGLTSVVIRSCDTDVLVILCHFLANTDREMDVWMDVGRDSNNTRRMISVNNVVKNLTKDVALALPGLHSFTGCDYVPAFLNKGKVKPLDMVIKNDMFKDCMKALGQGELSPETIEQCEAFICHLYGQQKEISVDKARYSIFQKTCAPKTMEDPLASIKGINPSAWPPCKAALTPQVQRANYVAAMWKRAHLPMPCTGSPIGHGWKMNNNTYSIHWYDGDQLPTDIYKALETSDIAVEESVEDDDVTYGEHLYGADEMFDEDD